MNIEIIPNWHPIFVHFTIGLFATSALLFLVGAGFSKQAWSETFLKVAHINLRIGAVFTVLTVMAGWDAYNTVTHDGPSHAAMTDHRNWALVTAGVWTVLAAWSFQKHRSRVAVGAPFLAAVVVASGLLAATGYKGGEAVYRFGLGVMSLPKVSGDGGHGSHSHGSSTEPHYPHQEQKSDASTNTQPEGHDAHEDDESKPHSHDDNDHHQ